MSRKLMLLTIVSIVLIAPGIAGAYTVQPGDTLSGLAQKFGVDMEELLRQNPDITDPNEIYAGQSINLPPMLSRTHYLDTTERKTEEKPLPYRLSLGDRQLLAHIVHAEAKGEPFPGKVAVAHVVLNRVNHDAFPDSVFEVIFQPRQFQPVANGTLFQKPDQESIDAVDYALKTYEHQNKDILYFYNPDIATSSWIFTRPTEKVIGNHVFAR